MRTQKYYDKRIMKEAFTQEVFDKIVGAYVNTKIDKMFGGKLVPTRHFRGNILEKAFHIWGRFLPVDFDTFKQAYENAKSPTVNNLEGAKEVWVDPQTGKEWICNNCGGKWHEGSPSCINVHSGMSSSLRPEYLPKKSPTVNNLERIAKPTGTWKVDENSKAEPLDMKGKEWILEDWVDYRAGDEEQVDIINNALRLRLLKSKGEPKETVIKILGVPVIKIERSI